MHTIFGLTIEWATNWADANFVLELQTGRRGSLDVICAFWLKEISLSQGVITAFPKKEKCILI